MLEKRASKGEYASSYEAPENDHSEKLEGGFDEQEIFDDGMNLKSQMQPRTFVLGIILGFVLTIVYINVVLSQPLVPSLNIAAGILSYSSMKPFVAVWKRFFPDVAPYTMQENTVIQTMVVACYGIAFAMGLASYSFALTPAEAAISDPPGIGQELTIPRLIGLGFGIAFFGIFLIVVIRKPYILDMKDKLAFPSGKATGVMISSFFSGNGDLPKRQFNNFLKWTGIQFFWDLFKWFYGAGGSKTVSCGGFGEWPFLGIRAMERFDFSYDWDTSVIGIGMIVPDGVNLSLFWGSIAAGFLWPSSGEGIIPAAEWYPPPITTGDMNGLRGLQVFSFIGILFGDGLYQIVKMARVVYLSRKKDSNEVAGDSAQGTVKAIEERLERVRERIFRSDSIKKRYAAIGMVLSMILGMTLIPLMFENPPTWYMILTAYFIIPLIALPNAYMTGMTDVDCSAVFAKLPLLLFSLWGGSMFGHERGVNSGLLVMGVVLAGSLQASTLLSDFKTGYITMSSPRAMFISQIFGAFVGCFFSPLVFTIYNTAYDLGNDNGPYPVPFGATYRGIAIIGTQGFSALPKYAGYFIAAFFFGSIVWSAAFDFVLSRTSKEKQYLVETFFPTPMAFGLGFYSGGSFGWNYLWAIIIKWIWRRRDKVDFDNFHLMFASALICGDGIWSFIQAIMILAGASSPMCMAFTDAASAENLIYNVTST